MDLISDVILNTAHLLLYYLLPFVAVLGVMIFFHELGHFLVAKHFGVKVLKFALGFGPKMAGKTVGETEYSIRYFPLGGFVKMLGEDPDDEELQDLTPEDAKRSFENQHVLKRIAIVAAGPTANIVLALLLFCGLFSFSGKQVLIPAIGQVRPGSPAQKAGLMKGDVIISIQGKPIADWTEIKDMVQDKAGKALVLAIQRTDSILEVTVTPEMEVSKNEFGEDVKSALIGIVSAGKLKKVKMGPLQAIKQGFKETWKWVKLTCLIVVKLFQGAVPFKSIGGPILIGQMTGQLAQDSFGNLIPFMAIISVNLGILNLFPIPILDGGLIIFLLLELLTGKPLSLRKREFAMKVGLALIILLMVAVTYNDLSRVLEKILG